MNDITTMWTCIYLLIALLVPDASAQSCSYTIDSSFTSMNGLMKYTADGSYVQPYVVYQSDNQGRTVTIPDGESMLLSTNYCANSSYVMNYNAYHNNDFVVCSAGQLRYQVCPYTVLPPFGPGCFATTGFYCAASASCSFTMDSSISSYRYYTVDATTGLYTGVPSVGVPNSPPVTIGVTWGLDLVTYSMTCVNSSTLLNATGYTFLNCSNGQAVYHECPVGTSSLTDPGCGAVGPFACTLPTSAPTTSLPTPTPVSLRDI
jgi:hypothetical protein